MKKNYFIIFLILLVIGLFLKGFALRAGGITLIIATSMLAIGYAIKGIRSFQTTYTTSGLKWITMTTSFYLVFTLIGLVFRHQFWSLPFWGVIFQIIWPILTLGLAIQIILHLKEQGKTEHKDDKKQLTKNTLIPLTIIVILAISTFLPSTETFCKIYKPYSADELYERWEQQKNK